jgi:hypothetical protein
MLMRRRVFYSFHYEADAWRAAMVRKMGVLEGSPPTSDNDWEEITKGGNLAIKRWIDGQMRGKSCAVVLIGSHTASRKWIQYEILTAWNQGLGVVGVYVDRLKNESEEQSRRGRNPFELFRLPDGTGMERVVEAHCSPYKTSKNTYAWIKDNLSDWVERAIEIRGEL